MSTMQGLQLDVDGGVAAVVAGDGEVAAQIRTITTSPWICLALTISSLGGRFEREEWRPCAGAVAVDAARGCR